LPWALELVWGLVCKRRRGRWLSPQESHQGPLCMLATSVVDQRLTHNSLIPGSGLDSSPAPTDPPSSNPGGTEAAADTTGSAAGSRPTYNSDCPALNNTV